MRSNISREVEQRTNQLMRDHYVSPQTGFLAENPLINLWFNPGASQYLSEYFQKINEVADNLEWLIREKQITETVNKLEAPPKWLNYDGLPREFLHSFMLKMTMLMHAYLREVYNYSNVSELLKDDREKPLCPQLAIPIWNLSKITGIQPSMSYALYSLWNYRKKDPLKSVTLSNLELIHSFTGTMDEKWFVWIHQVIEAVVAKGLEIEALLKAYFLTKEYDPDPKMVWPLLGIAANTENKAVNILERMREHCDYETYFRKVRLFYTIPRNIVFEGVDELQSKPLEILGETGGQSPSRHFRLMVMGVKHEEDQYFPRMRLHMSREHREIIELVSDSKIREFVLANRGVRPLVRRHNALVRAFVDWRDEHLSLVDDYIVDYGDIHGTGKPPVKWLLGLRDKTKTYLID